MIIPVLPEPCLQLQGKPFMKKILPFALILVSYNLQAQISGTPAVAPSSQPVERAVQKERSATPQPMGVVVPANPVPPIYPGAEQTPVVIPRDLVRPAAPPAPTQPEQREPLHPIESSNRLQPANGGSGEQISKDQINNRPSSRIYDTRVDKNAARAASTVEHAAPTRSNAVIYPVGNASTKKSSTVNKRKTPAKKKATKKKMLMNR